MSLFLLLLHPSPTIGFFFYVIGRPSTEYVSEETPMGPYGNLHIAFEQMRVKALRDIHGSPRPNDEQEGINSPPRVMILGPDNYGKTSIAKILVNYAVRAGQGWTPMVVNLDPGDVRISLFSSRTGC